jgi:two-component system, OmpR family, sensor histidine kinase KdpD
MSDSELADGAGRDRPGVSRIADARPQDRVTVTGTICETQTVTLGGSPAYRCVLSDGTGQLDLLFLGRAAVAGLAVGTRCSIDGTATERGGRLAVWNPRYQVEPPAEPSPMSAQEPGAADADESAHPALAAESPVAAEPAGAGVKDPAGPAGITGGVEAAGHFRIYLGVAAGAGKTIAMLDEGHRRRQQGADVVIGFVESHGRPVTERRIAGLEIVPRRAADYRSARFEEMDTDGVLRRRPEVVLVDELAHTNVPGSGRHGKRWQDVLELLDAGIDVVTTVNIQHLESIADAAEDMTGARIGERVPDWVVRQADQIELVDSPPEQVRRRMLNGNIYPAAQVPQALTHFFRADNLTALRDLALRFLADETGEELRAHLARYRTQAPWQAAERIMAGVTLKPGADAVVRCAARMAAKSQAGLDIVHITSGVTGGRDRDDGLARLRQVTSDVGGTWHHLHAEDPVSALIEFARSGQITQIVVGASHRSHWQELISGGSTVMRISRLAARAGFDVHIVAPHEMTAPRLAPTG